MLRSISPSVGTRRHYRFGTRDVLGVAWEKVLAHSSQPVRQEPPITFSRRGPQPFARYGL